MFIYSILLLLLLRILHSGYVTYSHYTL